MEIGIYIGMIMNVRLLMGISKNVCHSSFIIIFIALYSTSFCAIYLRFFKYDEISEK